jgi:hypothetical protein
MINTEGCPYYFSIYTKFFSLGVADKVSELRLLWNPKQAMAKDSGIG